MGNTLKSKHSRKSYNPKRTTETFRDYATALPPDSGGNAMSPEDRMSLRLSHGTPGLKDGIFHYPSHSFSFNHQRGVVNWTLELITPENFKGDIIGKKNVAWNIMKDKGVNYRGEKYKDYINTHYNEMACSEMHKNNKEELKATRCTTNMVIGDNNFSWDNLQLYAEENITNKFFSAIWVVSGPLFDRQRPDYLYDTKFEPVPNVIYRATTDNLIAIPNQLFKVFLAQDNFSEKEKLYLSCFRSNNCQTDVNDLWKREVLIKDLEKMIGFHIFPHLHPDYSNINSLSHFLRSHKDVSYEYSQIMEKLHMKKKFVATIRSMIIEKPMEPISRTEEVKSSTNIQLETTNNPTESLGETSESTVDRSESESGALEGQSINPTDPHVETSSLSLDKLSDIITEPKKLKVTSKHPTDLIVEDPNLPLNKLNDIETEPKKQEVISKHLTYPLEVNSQSSVSEMSNKPPISIKKQFDKSLENLTSHRKELKSHVGLLETHGEKLNTHGKDLKSHKEELKTHTELMKTFIKSSASGASVTLSSKSK